MLGRILVFISLFTAVGVEEAVGIHDRIEEDHDEILVMFWNLENFFDYKDGGEGVSDTEFSSFGSRHWSRKRFIAKCHAVAKTVFWMCDRYGRLPDVIGMAEIENSNVLFRLLRDTALKKTDYAFIHYDGQDHRGIDVALMYRKSVFKPASITRKQVIMPDGDTLRSRDILHVRMQHENASEGVSAIDFIVNHHPSKYGGAKESQIRREAAMTALKNLSDSLSSESKEPRIVAMGDFNDTPDSPPFRIIEESLVNKACDVIGANSGTIRYEGKWELIDMFLVSPEIAGKTVMEIVRVPFHMVRDTGHSGLKPFRTYSGPKYIGGISDHCPVILKLFLENNRYL